MRAWRLGNIGIEEIMNTRRWDLVHKFEDDYRRRYLKRMTVEEGLRIMEGLYQFNLMTNKGMGGAKITRDRTRFLIKERSRFKKLAV